MNPEDAIRRLRAPERWTPLEPMFLAPPAPRPGPVRTRPHADRLRVGLVTAVVLALVVVGAVSVIRLAGPTGPAVVAPSTAAPTPTLTPTPTPTPTPGTVGALPHVSGKILATFTDRSTLPASQVVNAAGESIAVVYTCTGGGSLLHSLSGIGDSSTSCSGISSGGPDVTEKDGSLVPEHQVTVHVSVKGHPRFALEVVRVPLDAVPAHPSLPTVATTGPGVPVLLRSCGENDLVPTATYSRWSGFEGGLVTITSASATDCAIRTFPALRYLDAAGRTIGAPASKSGSGPSEPVRLATHGTAYVQIELFKLARLTDCGAKQVASVQLTIGHATARVQIPSTPATGKCTASNVEADGVGAATGYKPTGP